jgi:hypothetical protein
MPKKLRAPTRNPVVVTAVHANVGTEAWYRDRLQAMVARMAASMVRHIEAAYRAAPPLSGFAADAPPTVTLNRALRKWGGLWVKKFDKMSLDLARRFVTKNFTITQRAMAAELKKAGFTVDFSPTLKSVEAYRAVVAENVNLIKSIPEQFLRDVQTSVWSSVMKGGGMGSLRE